MSLPDAYAGARHTGLKITWEKEDGTLQDLTGATVSAQIADTSKPSLASVASGGTFTLVDAAHGLFTWAYSAADVATPGSYLVQFKATYADTSFDLTVPKAWKVLKAT